MATAKWTSRAELDLEEIAFRVAIDDGRPATADQLVDDIKATADLYATQPQMGTRVPELGENLRIIPFKRWVIIYEAISKGILVRAIVDATRDYPNWRA
ncbi:MAG: type II toxin-antitoxin system RelE/ParE family toxin [Pirellulales bacterium]|nr:type II toxin-antitoxin system RelE/ParE family toxin [Pirellulales bacterium]